MIAISILKKKSDSLSRKLEKPSGLKTTTTTATQEGPQNSGGLHFMFKDYMEEIERRRKTILESRPHLENIPSTRA